MLVLPKLSKEQSEAFDLTPRGRGIYADAVQEGTIAKGVDHRFYISVSQKRRKSKNVFTAKRRQNKIQTTTFTHKPFYSKTSNTSSQKWILAKGKNSSNEKNNTNNRKMSGKASTRKTDQSSADRGVAGANYLNEEPSWKHRPLQHAKLLHNFQIVECGGSGDCLFYCVAKALNEAIQTQLLTIPNRHKEENRGGRDCAHSSSRRLGVKRSRLPLEENEQACLIRKMRGLQLDENDNNDNNNNNNNNNNKNNDTDDSDNSDGDEIAHLDKNLNDVTIRKWTSWVLNEELLDWFIAKEIEAKTRFEEVWGFWPLEYWNPEMFQASTIPPFMSTKERLHAVQSIIQQRCSLFPTNDSDAVSKQTSKNNNLPGIKSRNFKQKSSKAAITQTKTKTKKDAPLLGADLRPLSSSFCYLGNIRTLYLLCYSPWFLHFKIGVIIFTDKGRIDSRILHAQHLSPEWYLLLYYSTSKQQVRQKEFKQTLKSKRDNHRSLDLKSKTKQAKKTYNPVEVIMHWQLILYQNQSLCRANPMPKLLQEIIQQDCRIR